MGETSDTYSGIIGLPSVFEEIWDVVELDHRISSPAFIETTNDKTLSVTPRQLRGAFAGGQSAN